MTQCKPAFLVGSIAAALAACGVETDDRPPTFEVVFETIIKPGCARAGFCHSSSAAVEDLKLDVANSETRAAVKASICRLTDSCPGGEEPMPRDGRLSDADIALIEAWAASE